MTTIIIEDNGIQSNRFIEYVRTLPFVKFKEDKMKDRSTWEEAIAEGAVSVNDFFEEVHQQAKKQYDNHA